MTASEFEKKIQRELEKLQIMYKEDALGQLTQNELQQAKDSAMRAEIIQFLRVKITALLHVKEE